ncbi:BTB/POZ domain-containing protein at1g67900, partial [Phtheirospermum japonicum]
QFPLLSKCLLLQKLCSEIPEIPSHLHTLHLPDFPGPAESFELCAKFCYGITITLSAHNIVPIRCASEYLQMTESVETGNLIQKLDAFFISCILNGWRDTIVVLQSTKAFPQLSEDLGITTRCVEAIASKILAKPSKISYSRSIREDISCNGSEGYYRHNNNNNNSYSNNKGWWGEDLAELGIDLYWRTMIAVRSRIPSVIIGDALRIYVSRWLTNLSSAGSSSDCEKDRVVLESVISLLPVEKGAVSCSFLMKLLKASNILKVSSSSRKELARRVGFQLEEATVGDLLVPCLAKNAENVMYDVDIVTTILEVFMSRGRSPPTSPSRERSRRSSSAAAASHGCKIKVARIIDGYLQEIAKDENLGLSKFVAIAEAIPEFARVEHDDLYKAIDIFLKGHPELDKSERKRLCRILDCKKLSLEACMHAAQNEKLPLRVVVQVLFFEQARATMSSNGQVTDDELPSNIKALLATNKISSKPATDSFTTNITKMPPDDQWSTVSGLKTPKSNISTLKMKLAEDDDDDVYDDFPDGFEKNSKIMSFCMIPSKPKRIFSKLWRPINRNVG